MALALLYANVLFKILKSTLVMDKQEFLKYLTGPGSTALFAACLSFCFALSAARILLTLNKRNPKSANTPKEFSRKFFWLDNAGRIIGNVIIAIVFVRFIRTGMFPIKIDTITSEPIEKSPDLQLMISALIGLLSDFLFRWLQKLRLLGNRKVRERFKKWGLEDSEQDQVDSEEENN